MAGVLPAMVRTSLILAAGCAALAFSIGLAVRPPCRHENPRSLVPVVVAAVDVPPGTPLTYDMLSQRSMPEMYVVSSMVKPDAASHLLGGKSLRPIAAGELLLWNDFPAGTSRALPKGAHAVAVDLGHEVSAGDVIDLRQPDGSLLVEGARVLTPGKSPWLQVSEQEAAAIARNRSALTAVLRASP